MYCTTVVSINEIFSTAPWLLMSKLLSPGLLTSGLLTFGLLVYWCLMLDSIGASSKGQILTRILCNRRSPNSCCSLVSSSCHPVFVFWLAFSIIILFEWGDWNVNNEIILLNFFTYHSSTGTDCHRLMMDIQVGFNKIIISTSSVFYVYLTCNLLTCMYRYIHGDEFWILREIFFPMGTKTSLFCWLRKT